MLYEFIATIAAGFALAGVALLMQHLAKLAKKKTPKWLVPIFAGIGMLFFQIHQEYHWYDQQTTSLPERMVVVKTIEDSAWFRPWTYLKPQTIRFMAVDKGNIQIYNDKPHIKLINLYLFERRMSTKTIPQLIDCQQKTRANSLQDLEVSANWIKLTDTDELIKAICS